MAIDVIGSQNRAVHNPYDRMHTTPAAFCAIVPFTCQLSSLLHLASPKKNSICPAWAAGPPLRPGDMGY